MPKYEWCVLATWGSTWDLMIPKFRYDLRPSGTLTEYRIHLSTTLLHYITFSSHIACVVTYNVSMYARVVRIYKCMYLFVNVCMQDQICSITKNIQEFVLKYLSNFTTKLHNVTKCDSTDSYCSFCTVLTRYSNVSWSESGLKVYSQFSVPFCPATRHYKAAQYAISRQINRTWQEDKSSTV